MKEVANHQSNISKNTERQTPRHSLFVTEEDWVVEGEG